MLKFEKNTIVIFFSLFFPERIMTPKSYVTIDAKGKKFTQHFIKPHFTSFFAFKREIYNMSEVWSLSPFLVFPNVMP